MLRRGLILRPYILGLREVNVGLGEGSALAKAPPVSLSANLLRKPPSPCANQPVRPQADHLTHGLRSLASMISERVHQPVCLDLCGTFILHRGWGGAAGKPHAIEVRAAATSLAPAAHDDPRRRSSQ